MAGSELPVLVSVNWASRSGGKIADLNGQTLNTAWVPLSGGSFADYHSGGLDDYAFADWLGSPRLSSTPGRAKKLGCGVCFLWSGLRRFGWLFDQFHREFHCAA